MKRIAIYMVTYLLLGTIANAQSFNRLNEELKNYIQEKNIPGAAVAIVSNDSVLFMACYGYADIEKKESVTVNTHFMLGSITKSFLALGISKLAEEGKVDLGTPIIEVLPNINIKNPWVKTDPVRIVHLLEHTAGLCDGSSTLFNWRHEPDIPLKDAILMQKEIVINSRPGSFYLYSNNGYLIAGAILEEVSQMRYEEFLKNEILNPLRMETSTFYTEDSYSRSVLAQGYGVNGKEIPYVYTYQRSSAHTHSSVNEMAKYVIFYLNSGESNGKQIINPESMKRMETPKSSLASRVGMLNGYGLGNEWTFRNNHKWRGHNGAIFGYYSDFWYNQDLDIGYVVLINQFDLESAGKVRQLRMSIANFLTEGDTTVFQPIVSTSNIDLKKYCGNYTVGYKGKDPLGLINIITGITEVKLSDDTLILRNLFSGDRESFFQVSKGLFRKQNIPEATLAIFTTPEGLNAMVNRQEYFEEISLWKYWFLIVFLIWSILVMLSTVIYIFFWFIIYLYKRASNKHYVITGIYARMLPFAATLILVLGFLSFANQEMYFLGKLSFANISLFISTWLFAILSVVSLISAIKSLKRSLKKALRIYFMIVACTFVSMSLFLWYWGIIGLKLWA